jgi:DNA replication and repair protein RecF
MHLSKLILRNYRSYQQAEFSFSPHTNLILGQNGAGKTNLLEAINLLSSGKSFRSVSLLRLIFWNQGSTQIRALVSHPNQDLDLEVQLISKPDSSSISRKFLINQVQKTRKAFLGQIKTVIFSPEDIRLTTGSPNRRRDF